MADIQRNIIIGADAQQFYDAMRGINNQIAHVDATLKQMEKSQMRNVASGHLLSQAITDIGRAFVQYIQGAVEKAQQLPPGLFKSVDALREVRTEAENIDLAFGVMASDGIAKATTAMANFKAASLGQALSGGANATDPFGWLNFVTNYKQLTKVGYEAADAVAAVVDKMAMEAEANKELGEWEKAFSKAKDKSDKDAAKASEAAQKAAEKQKEALQEELRIMREINLENAKKEADAKAQIALQNDVYQFNEDVYAMEQWIASAREKQQQQVSAANAELQKQAELVGLISGAFNDMFYTALISGKDFFQQMGLWVENYIKRLAAAAAAAGALTLLTGGGGAGFWAVFKGLAGLTKMAHGGIVNKATPLIAGEAGPEAIIPLNKLNGMGGNLSARISGRDLLLLLEREQTVKSRGYGK